MVLHLRVPPCLPTCQDIEATLHSVMSIQEAIDLTESTPHLPRLFGREILGRLPQTGQPRVRRTMLGVIGAQLSTPSIDVLF